VKVVALFNRASPYVLGFVPFRDYEIQKNLISKKMLDAQIEHPTSKIYN
jgi:hypothetical protein